MTTLDFDTMYEAIGSKGSEFEGIFFTCVKTTGIFCRPSCRARKPRPENVEFFPTQKEALQHGYRPCKLCRPMELPDQPPAQISTLLAELATSPWLRLRDQDLRDRGIEPASLRRWFKSRHRMTFQTYQRMLRLNFAYRELESGNSVTDTAFDAGFESISGFTQRYKEVLGVSPGRARARMTTGQGIIHLVRFSTPLGPMFAGATDRGLCLLEFTDRRMLETEIADLQKRLQARFLPGNHPILDKTQTELSEYFAGARREFSIPLDAPGTEFQKQVWRELQNIPYGQTRSYAEQAAALDKPKAVRAVAAANGRNRIAIIIPCHRVIGADGSLTGYGGGLPRKQALLDLEATGIPRDA